MKLKLQSANTDFITARSGEDGRGVLILKMPFFETLTSDQNIVNKFKCNFSQNIVNKARTKENVKNN